mmetsp:Transcript_16812/g.23037  ORF Transcript_16812/g.23037 Transcript_16812/m.23037 type:complete len:100 (+) Transcript_16812:1069-1368(+)
MYLKKYLHFLPSKCSPPTCGQAVLRTEPRPKPSTAAAALIFLYVNSTRAREPLRLCARLLSQENHAHLSRYPTDEIKHVHCIDKKLKVIEILTKGQPHS